MFRAKIPPFSSTGARSSMQRDRSDGVCWCAKWRSMSIHIVRYICDLRCSYNRGIHVFLLHSINASHLCAGIDGIKPDFLEEVAIRCLHRCVAASMHLSPSPASQTPEQRNRVLLHNSIIIITCTTGDSGKIYFCI